jgi:uncharacterized protein YlxW (UPF0749 family)
MQNALEDLRTAQKLEQIISDIQDRLTTLEAKIEDIEAVLSSLCVSRKKPGVLNSWLRALVHRGNLTPGSTIGPV